MTVCMVAVEDDFTGGGVQGSSSSSAPGQQPPAPHSFAMNPQQPSDLTRIFSDKHFSDLTRVLLCITYLYQNTVDTIHLMSLKIKEILYTVHF